MWIIGKPRLPPQRGSLSKIIGQLYFLQHVRGWFLSCTFLVPVNQAAILRMGIN